MDILVDMVHGSHLYGVNTKDSDIDYKGVYLPTKEEIYLGEGCKEIRSSTGSDKSKNTSEDIDKVYFSLHKFINMACAGETIAIDMLHCDNPLMSTPLWEDLRSKRSMFYTKNMKAFLGYVKKQSHKYGVKGSKLEALEVVIKYLSKKDKTQSLDDLTISLGLEGVSRSYPEYVKVMRGFHKGDKFIQKDVVEVCGAKYDMSCKVSYVVKCLEDAYNSYGARAQQAKENKGVDWKALSHAVRSAYQLKEIYETGDLVYPLKERDVILSIKLGEWDFTTEVSPLLSALIEDVEELSRESDYPETVDKAFWNNWLIEVYNNEFN